jgi:hypothetical protein
MGSCLSSDASPVTSPTKAKTTDISANSPTITVDVTVMNPVPLSKPITASQKVCIYVHMYIYMI